MGERSIGLRGVLGAAIMAAGVLSAVPAMAQTPTKVLFDDGKVRVQEVTFRPGDQGPNIPRPFRVIRVLQGGTLQRTYSDGRTERVEYKTGEVKVYEADAPFVPKNVGTRDLVLYVVAIRAPKE